VIPAAAGPAGLSGTKEAGNVNRLAVHVTEVYLRHAARQYLDYCRSVRGGGASIATATTSLSNGTTPAASAPASPVATAPSYVSSKALTHHKRLNPGLLLLHGGVPRRFLPLPTEHELLVGDDPCCDVVLHSSFVQSFAAFAYPNIKALLTSERNGSGATTADPLSLSGKAAGSRGRVSNHSDLSQQEASFRGRSGSRVTPLATETLPTSGDMDRLDSRVAASLSIRHHISVPHVRGAAASLTRNPDPTPSQVEMSVVAKGLAGRGMFVDGQVVAPFTETQIGGGGGHQRHRKTHQVLKFSLAPDAPMVTFSNEYPYRPQSVFSASRVQRK
jgi:hypothetical protein